MLRAPSYPGSIRKPAPPHAGSSLRRRQTVEPLRKSPPRTSPATPLRIRLRKGSASKVAGFYSATRDRVMPPLRGLLLLRRVQALHVAADDGAVEHIEGGKQRRCAMAFVVVGTTSSMQATRHPKNDHALALIRSSPRPSPASCADLVPFIERCDQIHGRSLAQAPEGRSKADENHCAGDERDNAKS